MFLVSLAGAPETPTLCAYRNIVLIALIDQHEAGLTVVMNLHFILPLR